MSAVAKPLSWPDQQAELFRDRFGEWLRLRAEMAAFDRRKIPSGQAEEAYLADHLKLSQQLEDATRLAMTTHAPRAWMVWKKFEILDEAFFEDEADPSWTDRREIWMLGAIKADLAALGIRDPLDK